MYSISCLWHIACTRVYRYIHYTYMKFWRWALSIVHDQFRRLRCSCICRSRKSLGLNSWRAPSYNHRKRHEMETCKSLGIPTCETISVSGGHVSDCDCLCMCVCAWMCLCTCTVTARMCEELSARVWIKQTFYNVSVSDILTMVRPPLCVNHTHGITLFCLA